MEFVTWDLYAAINIRECAVLETRPAEPTRSSIVGQPLRLEVHKAKLQPMAGAGQELLGGVWDWIYIYLPWLWDIFFVSLILHSANSVIRIGIPGLRNSGRGSGECPQLRSAYGYVPQNG